MSSRKAWTKQQDQVLKQLYQVRRVKKWVDIAKIMEKQFNIKGKNGKQCRQRYHNHLDQSIKHQKWSQEQELQLLNLQSQWGNKWAQISRVINGRSQNDIKNQFFSIMRRGLRCINLIIRKNLKRNSQLQISLIHKILQNSQKNSKKKLSHKQYAKNISLKKTIVKYSLINPEQFIDKANIQQIKQFTLKLNPSSSNKTQQKPQQKQLQKIVQQKIVPAQLIPLTRNLLSKKSFQSNKSNISRQNSFFIINQFSEQHQNDQQNKLKYVPCQTLTRSKSKSIFQNPSFDGLSLKYMQFPSQQESMFKFHQGDYQFITTPTPKPIITPSPYFDQVRSSFHNWGNFFAS